MAHVLNSYCIQSVACVLASFVEVMQSSFNNKKNKYSWLESQSATHEK